MNVYLPLAKQVRMFLATCLLGSQPLKCTCRRGRLIFNNNIKPTGTGMHNQHHKQYWLNTYAPQKRFQIL